MTSPEECIYYARKNIIPAIYRTVKIEVPSITLPDTENIIKNGHIQQLQDSDIVTVINLKHAWEKLLSDYQEFPDFVTISSYNREIGRGIIDSAGEMRTSSVAISGTGWRPSMPDMAHITSDLDEAYQENDAGRRALIRFAKTCRGQWFSDGNKRTAAMIANHSLIQDGVGVFLIDEEKLSNGDFASNLISYYENNNIESFVDWLEEYALIRL